MSDKKINKNELIILGMIAEKPYYGYEISKIIKQRGMVEWTDIGFSSIYAVLKKLERSELIKSNAVISDQNKIQKRYSITKKGMDILKNDVKIFLSTIYKDVYELDLGIACLPVLSENEVIESLIIREKKLLERVDHLKDRKKQKTKGEVPFFVKGMFDRRIAKTEAELKWLRSFIKEIEKGGLI